MGGNPNGRILYRTGDSDQIRRSVDSYVPSNDDGWFSPESHGCLGDLPAPTFILNPCVICHNNESVYNRTCRDCRLELALRKELYQNAPGLPPRDMNGWITAHAFDPQVNSLTDLARLLGAQALPEPTPDEKGLLATLYDWAFPP